MDVHHNLLLCILVSAIYCLVRFVEIKYLAQSMLPMKQVVRELVFVFGSVFAGAFILTHFGHHIDALYRVVTDAPPSIDSRSSANAEIFTGPPEF